MPSPTVDYILGDVLMHTHVVADIVGAGAATDFVVLAPSTDARNVIQPTAADVKALVLKGATSQSDNLLETQNDSGTASAYLDKFGRAALNAGDLCGSETTAVLSLQGTSIGYGIRLYRGSLNFDLQNDGTFPYIGTQSNHSFVFMTNNTGRLWMAADGKVKVSNSSSPAATGQLDVVSNDAATNSATTVLVVGHNTSGTAAAGFGSNILFQLESSTTTESSAGLISCSWTVATHATRTSEISFSTYYTSTAQEILTLTANSAGVASSTAEIQGALILGSGSGNTTHLSSSSAGGGFTKIVSRPTTTTTATNYRIQPNGNPANAYWGIGAFKSSFDMFDVDYGFGNNNFSSLTLINAASACGIVNYHANASSPKVMIFGRVDETNNLFRYISITTAGVATHRLTDAATNAISTHIILAHTTSGTPAAGLGSALVFQLESSTTDDQNAGKITCAWGVATHASREGIVSIIATDYGGDRTGMQVTGDGTNTEIGFFGVTPVARPAALTQTYSTANRTHAALTSATLTDNSAGTANTTVQALTDPADTPASADALRDDLVANIIPELRNNFADIVAQINALRVDIDNAKQFVNTLADDLQSLGLAQ